MAVKAMKRADDKLPGRSSSIPKDSQQKLNHLYYKLPLAAEKEAYLTPQLNDIAEATRAIASSFDIERIYLFGSHARNEATETSDIDLCLETGNTFSLFNAGAFVTALEETLKIPIDVVSQESLYEFSYKEYLRDRVLLYERELTRSTDERFA